MSKEFNDAVDDLDLSRVINAVKASVLEDFSLSYRQKYALDVIPLDFSNIECTITLKKHLSPTNKQQLIEQAEEYFEYFYHMHKDKFYAIKSIDEQDIRNISSILYNELHDLYRKYATIHLNADINKLVPIKQLLESYDFKMYGDGLEFYINDQEASVISMMKHNKYNDEQKIYLFNLLIEAGK